jgi:tetratricopeptide (TPR) repeat protein
VRLNNKWLIVLFILASFFLSGCVIVRNLQAKSNLNEGVKAYNKQKYGDAVQCFEKALQLKPNFESARVFLGMAYSSQYIPGSLDSQNLEIANKAIRNFEEVVTKAEDPSKPNKSAMISLANIYSQMKQIEKSKEWCHRIITSYPNTPEAYYRIATLDVDDALDRTGIDGKNVAKMKPEDTVKVLANIEEGLTALGKALEMRPDYFEAMDCQNRLLRERIKFEKDPKAKEKLKQQADLLYINAIALRKKAQEPDNKKVGK